MFNTSSYLITEAERIELKFVGVKTIYKLRYLKGSKETAVNAGLSHIDSRLWDILSPMIPGYVYSQDSGVPTLGVDGLRKLKII